MEEKTQVPFSGTLAQELQLVGGKLVLGGFNGVQQEITVVFSILHHDHALVSFHENLFPEPRIF